MPDHREQQVRVDYRVEVEDKEHPELVGTPDPAVSQVRQEQQVPPEQREVVEVKVCPV